MLLKLLKTEQMKLKRSPVWLAFFIMPIVPALLGTLNYLGNLKLLKSQWYSLWTQHTLFTCYFFLPVMIGVYCSYLIGLEHSSHNWNKLLALPVNKKLIFTAKVITAAFLIFISELWIGALFILSGKLIHMPSTPPYQSILIWCLFGTLGGIVMASIQLLLSIYIKSFAVPVGISFAGGLSGLLFLAKGFGHIWPYSLIAYGMNSNAPQKMMESGYVPFLLVCIFFILFFTVIAGMLLEKKEFS